MCIDVCICLPVCMRGYKDLWFAFHVSSLTARFVPAAVCYVTWQHSLRSEREQVIAQRWVIGVSVLLSDWKAWAKWQCRSGADNMAIKLGGDRPPISTACCRDQERQLGPVWSGYRIQGLGENGRVPPSVSWFVSQKKKLLTVLFTQTLPSPHYTHLLLLMQLLRKSRHIPLKLTLRLHTLKRKSTAGEVKGLHLLSLTEIRLRGNVAELF